MSSASRARDAAGLAAAAAAAAAQWPVEQRRSQPSHVAQRRATSLLLHAAAVQRAHTAVRVQVGRRHLRTIRTQSRGVKVLY